MSTRNLLMLITSTIAVGLVGAIAYFYLLPMIEKERREQAQTKWLEIVASRNGEKQKVQGALVDGTDEDAYVLAKCFKKGEPAANSAAILATAGRKEVHEDGNATYHWTFKVRKPKEVDATLLFLSVWVSGQPPIIEGYGAAYSGD